VNEQPPCPFYNYHREPNQLLLVPSSGHECGFVPPFTPCVFALRHDTPSLMDCPVVLLDQNFGHVLQSGYALVWRDQSEQPLAPPAAPEGR
jgi:hypothetical protein